MKAQELMAKAIQATVPAKLLLEAGDADGACNRAYYAMFDAARAALFTSGAAIRPEIAKTHNGLISAFSLHLVKTGRVSVDLGKALNKAEELRLIADYKGDPITRRTRFGRCPRRELSSKPCRSHSCQWNRRRVAVGRTRSEQAEVCEYLDLPGHTIIMVKQHNRGNRMAGDTPDPKEQGNRFVKSQRKGVNSVLIMHLHLSTTNRMNDDIRIDGGGQ